MTTENVPSEREIIKDHKRRLDAMFSKQLMDKYLEEDTGGLMRDFIKSLKKTEDRYLLEHSQIQTTIAEFIADLGWEAAYEVPFADFEYNFRFDVMAKKNSKTIVVEVKPEIDYESLGQILTYLANVTVHHDKVRVFLATDILTAGAVFDSELSDVLMEAVKTHKLGLIFVDANGEIWIFPAEMIK